MPIPLPASLLAAASGGSGGGATAAGSEDVTPLQMMPYTEQFRAGPDSEGESDLSEEEDGFYDTNEHNEMQERWERYHNVCDELDEAVSLRGMVQRLRALADTLEQDAEEGFEIDMDNCGGVEINLRNPRIEREQWSLRRRRRRAQRQAERASGASQDTEMVDGSLDVPLREAPPPAQAPAQEAPAAAQAAAQPAAGQAVPPPQATLAAVPPKSPQAPAPLLHGLAAFEIC